MSRARAFLVHVVLPLAAGAALYVGWRDESLLGWGWARALGVDGAAHALRGALRELATTLPEPIVYVLPDALWVYALTFALARLHARSGPIERASALSVPLLLGPGAELAQAAGALPGTFDVLDLLATVLAFAAAFALSLRRSGARDRSRRAPDPTTHARALENA